MRIVVNFYHQLYLILKHILFVIIIITCIATLNAEVTAITPTKVQIGSDKITSTLTTASADTDASSYIKFHTAEKYPPKVDCEGFGKTTITCKQAFAQLFKPHTSKTNCFEL